jgi:hypothetical protein
MDSRPAAQPDKKMDSILSAAQFLVAEHQDKEIVKLRAQAAATFISLLPQPVPRMMANKVRSTFADAKTADQVIGKLKFRIGDLTIQFEEVAREQSRNGAREMVSTFLPVTDDEFRAAQNAAWEAANGRAPSTKAPAAAVGSESRGLDGLRGPKAKSADISGINYCDGYRFDGSNSAALVHDLADTRFGDFGRNGDAGQIDTARTLNHLLREQPHLVGAKDSRDASRAGGMYPLHAAVQVGNVHAVRELLSAGAQLEQMKNNGCTPLLVAIHAYGQGAQDNPLAGTPPITIKHPLA